MKNILLIITLLFSTQVFGTVYEDAEDKRTDRWKVYDNTPIGATIDNVTLENRDQNVIEFTGAGTSNGYILGNWENRDGAWNNTKEHTLKWSMNFDEGYTVYVRIMTKDGARYIYYTPSDKSYGKRNNKYIHIGLGSKSNNGTWQDFSRDLASDLKKYEPNNKLVAVNAFLIRGNGFVDNVELVNTQSKNTIESINAKSDENTLTLSMNGSFEVGSHGSFFIDADNDSSTGYSNGAVKGAEYLVEETVLYRYEGNGRSWTWDSISSEIEIERTFTKITSKIALNLMEVSNKINYISGVSTPDWKERVKYVAMEAYTLLDAVDTIEDKWYKPKLNTSWQIQLTGKINTEHKVDVYDIDLFDTSKELIQSLHQKGKKIICYFSAGSYEDWREDEGTFPNESLGKKLDDWEGEKWLDIRNNGLKKVMIKRMDLAKEKGCDGVDPDNVDGYTNNTGFNLTAEDQLKYNRFLAKEAHKRGLSIGLKNNLDQIKSLVEYFDFAVNEQCHVYNECKQLLPFITHGKPILNIEYAPSYRQAVEKSKDLCIDREIKKMETQILPLFLDDKFKMKCK